MRSLSTNPNLLSVRPSRDVAVARALPTLLCLMLLGACSTSEPGGPVTQVSMLVVSGDAQSAPVGTELPAPLVAKLVDSKGRPVKGQTVNFRVTSGGGSVFAGAATTNEAGIAQERWTIGLSTAEPQVLEARTVDGDTGEAITLGTFTAVGLPLPPSKIERVSVGEGPAGGQATTVVRVSDVHGNGVPGETVSWAPSDSTVQAAAPTSVTDAHGEASMQWTLSRTDGVTFVYGRWNGQATTVSVRTLQGASARLVPSVVDFMAGQNIPHPTPSQTDLLGGLPGDPPLLEHNVVVMDGNGKPVPNAVLILKVVEGGGKIIASTGVDGQHQPEGTQATVRANEYGQLYTKRSYRETINPYWRLGPGEGLNVFSVAIPGGEEVRFTANARSPFVHIIWPVDGHTLTSDVVDVRGFVCRPPDSDWAAPQVHVGDDTKATSGYRTSEVRCGEAGAVGISSLPSGPITASLSTTRGDGTVASATVTVTKP